MIGPHNLFNPCFLHQICILHIAIAGMYHELVPMFLCSLHVCVCFFTSTLPSLFPVVVSAVKNIHSSTHALFHPLIHLSAHLPSCPFICLSLSLYWSSHPNTYPPSCPSVHSSTHPSVCFTTTHLPICLSIHSLHPSFCLSTHVPMYPHTHTYPPICLSIHQFIHSSTDPSVTKYFLYLRTNVLLTWSVLIIPLPPDKPSISTNCMVSSTSLSTSQNLSCLLPALRYLLCWWALSEKNPVFVQFALTNRTWQQTQRYLLREEF